MKCHVCGFEGLFEELDVSSHNRDSVFFVMTHHGGRRPMDSMAGMGGGSYAHTKSRRDGLVACPECGTVRLDREVKKDREKGGTE